jgi:hypothetical protein
MYLSRDPVTFLIFGVLYREREKIGLVAAASTGDGIPPLMGDPEIQTWDDNQDYHLSSSNRNRSKSNERIDRSPRPRSRSRYFDIQTILYLHKFFDITALISRGGSETKCLETYLLLFITGLPGYIQGEIEVKVQMKENVLRLIMSHGIKGENQI